MKRVLVLLKRSAYDLYVGRYRDPAFTSLLSSDRNRVIGNLLDRHRVHESSFEKCKDVLNRKSVAWESLMRDELDKPIRDVDLVVTVGGDGTLLQASHYLNSSIPVLGVNSDPTRIEELQVEQQLDEFDATRSRGYLCTATADNFEQVLTEIMDGRWQPRTLHRLSTSIDGKPFPTPGLNDVLLAHPNPAAVTRCTFSINQSTQAGALIHARSSGLRVCTAAGSTAATQSAGGYPMPLESKDLQYMLREPILPHTKHKQFMHGFVHADEVMEVTWGCRQGCMYFDGAHIFVPVKFGSVITISANGPPLQVFLKEK